MCHVIKFFYFLKNLKIYIFFLKKKKQKIGWISSVQTKLGVVLATPNFFFFLNIFFYFLFKIKIKNKLHDTCQYLIGLCVIFVSQLTVNG
jgi:hypothetical protein